MNRILGAAGKEEFGVSMGAHIFKIKQELIAEGREFATASVSTEPSFTISADDPAANSTKISGKIVLTENGQIFGTTGNDEIDKEIISRLSEFLHQKSENSVLVVQPLSDIQRKFHINNGRPLNILFERFEPAPKLVIIGAGEIGRAVAQIATPLDFKIIVVDERKELANQQQFPMAESIVCEPDLREALSRIPLDESCYVVIAVQPKDERPVRYCLNRPWAYCGMLGSKEKIGAIWEKLRSEGAPADRLKAVHAPIGFDIGAKSPQEIAIAILAEVLAVRNKANYRK